MQLRQIVKWTFEKRMFFSRVLFCIPPLPPSLLSVSLFSCLPLFRSSFLSSVFFFRSFFCSLLLSFFKDFPSFYPDFWLLPTVSFRTYLFCFSLVFLFFILFSPPTPFYCGVLDCENKKDLFSYFFLSILYVAYCVYDCV